MIGDACCDTPASRRDARRVAHGRCGRRWAGPGGGRRAGRAARLSGRDRDGVGIRHTFHDDDPYDEAVAAWDDQVGVNLRGAFCTIHAAAAHLRRDGGWIITISSIPAHSGGSSPGAAADAAARSGLLGLTRGLARELTPHGATVNAIAPGFINSDFHGGDNAAANAEKVLDAIPPAASGNPTTSPASSPS